MIHRLFHACFRPYVRLMLRVCFRRVDVAGVENVPRDRPVLLVGNHVTGPLDGMVLLAALDRRILMTSRADLLKNPLLRFVLWGLDAAYFVRREEHGRERADAVNAAGLARCAGTLATGGAVLIFPEGKSHSEPRRLPFKPGAARIALHHLATELPGAPLAVVPFGISFRDKARFRTDARLEIGPEVGLAAALAASPGEDPVRALTGAFESAVESALAPIHWAPPPAESHPVRDLLRSLDSLLLGAPVFAFGAINHLLPWAATEHVTRRLSTDLDHVAPSRFYAGLAIYPLFYALQAAAAIAFGPAWAALYLAILPLAGLYALAYLDRLGDLAASVRAARRRAAPAGTAVASVPASSTVAS